MFHIGCLVQSLVNLPLMLVEPRFDYLVVDGNRPVPVGRNHAVQQEQTLEEEVEGDPKEEDIAGDLNEREGAVDHPIRQPLGVIIRFLALNGLDRGIGRVEEPNEIAEEGGPVAHH